MRAPPVVRTLTIFDLAACAAFALPGVASLALAALDHVARKAGFAPMPAIEGGAMFFVNLAGIFGVAWNIVMLRNASAGAHRVDLAARLGVIGLIAFHIANSGLSPLFGVFIVTELVGGAAKWTWLRRSAAA